MTDRPNKKPRSDKKYFTDEERKAANREKAKRHYDKNPKRSNAIWLSYSRSIKGRAQALRSGAQQRAKKKNQPMELDNEWLMTRLEQGHCEVTGLPFVLDSPTDCSIHPFTPSVDKIVPALGYTKENCRLVLFAVNAAKQDWSDDILKQICKAITMSDNAQSDTATATTLSTTPVLDAITALRAAKIPVTLERIVDISRLPTSAVLEVLGRNSQLLSDTNAGLKFCLDADQMLRILPVNPALADYSPIKIAGEQIMNEATQKAISQAFASKSRRIVEVGQTYIQNRPNAVEWVEEVEAVHFRLNFDRLRELGFYKSVEELVATLWAE